jgi:hypothetical protein
MKQPHEASRECKRKTQLIVSQKKIHFIIEIVISFIQIRTASSFIFIKRDKMKFLIVQVVFLISAIGISTSKLNNDTKLTRRSLKACKKFDEAPVRFSSRIVGGKEVEIDEFPHFAAIGKRNDHSRLILFKCGGTLISERFVISAAHCKREICFDDVSKCVVRLGTIFMDENDESLSGIDFNIKVDNTRD